MLVLYHDAPAAGGDSFFTSSMNMNSRNFAEDNPSENELNDEDVDCVMTLMHIDFGQSLGKADKWNFHWLNIQNLKVALNEVQYV